MLSVLKATGLSPEELGEVIGVSGMTLRQWLKKPKHSAVPAVYIPAIREACYKLIAQERLDAQSPSVQAIMVEAQSGQYRAALQNLGLQHGFVIVLLGK